MPSLTSASPVANAACLDLHSYLAASRFGNIALHQFPMTTCLLIWAAFIFVPIIAANLPALCHFRRVVSESISRPRHSRLHPAEGPELEGHRSGIACCSSKQDSRFFRFHPMLLRQQPVFMNPPRVAFSDSPARRRLPQCVRRPGSPPRGGSRYPLGYFAGNTPPPDFSCPAAKAPVAACSMK
jgi:hypothetical protein